jgi:hypothetical protein
MYALANSFITSYSLNFCKAAEDIAMRDSNRALIGLYQLAFGAVLIENIRMIQEIAKASLFSDNMLGNFMIVPCLLLIADHKLESLLHQVKNKHILSVIKIIKTPIELISQRVGSIYLVAAAISYLVSIYFGLYGIASVGLINLAFGYLDRRNLIPSKVNYIYWKVLPWINFGFSLYSMDYKTLTISALQVYSALSKKYFKFISHPFETVAHPHLLTFADFKAIKKGKVSLEVDRSHLHILPFPLFLNGDSKEELQAIYQPLKELNQNFFWNEENIHLLRAQVEHDVRYRGANADEDKINYVKERIETLIEQIQNKKIETGSIINYPILQNYLACISIKLPKARRQQQEQILLQLATEGGDRCGPGISYQLETAATSLLENTDLKQEMPLKQKILLLLQQERLRIIQGLYQIFKPYLKPLLWLSGGAEKVHAMNTFVNLFVPNSFAPPHHGASEDLAARVNKVDSLIYSFMFGIRQNFFWENCKIETFWFKPGALIKFKFKLKIHIHQFTGYSVEGIRQVIRENVGSLINKSNVIEWALNWIDQSEASEHQKEAFREKLENGSFENFNSSMSYDFLNAMLVDMGIFKPDLSKNSSANT